MKLSVKTLKGNHFSIDVNSSDTVLSLKKQIEDIQGKDAFPSSQQLLIHQGKVLKDETTIEENKVAENGFLVVMLTKSKAPAATPSSTSAASSAQPIPGVLPPAPSPSPAAPASPVAMVSTAPSPAPTPVPVPAPAPLLAPADADMASNQDDVYGEAASNLVAGTGLQQTIQHILDMGGGAWDRDTVVRALRAAFNNPERAVEYLYNGVPESADVAAPVVPVPAAAPALAQPVPAGGPNAAPLDLFPQGMPAVGAAAPGTLDFLRTNPQFQALRAMVQANPHILQPMLQELGRQNPQLLRLINDNRGEFLRLINEAVAEGPEGDLLGELDGAIPSTISVTPEEREAIERLEALGFDRALVIEAFLACDKNEQLAANYLLEHSGWFLLPFISENNSFLEIIWLKNNPVILVSSLSPEKLIFIAKLLNFQLKICKDHVISVAMEACSTASS